MKKILLFGLIHRSRGAKKYFALEIEPDDTETCFNRADGGYKLVLQGNADTGE